MLAVQKAHVFARGCAECLFTTEPEVIPFICCTETGSHSPKHSQGIAEEGRCRDVCSVQSAETQMLLMKLSSFRRFRTKYILDTNR